MAHTRAAWRFTKTTDGVQCVTKAGEVKMLPLSVGSWDSSEVQIWESLVEALELFGGTLSIAGEKIGVYENDYNKFKERLYACYD